MQTLWDQRYAQRINHMKGSIIRELLKLTEDPEIISFAGGMPAPEAFPTQEFGEACNRVLAEKGAQALQYGMTEGYTPLRELLARHTARFGIEVTTDNLLVTSGSQQALDLLGKLFINPGDRILIEAPTYLGAMQAWNAYGAEYISVQSDADGMNTDEIEAALRTGPKFIYVLPNFQNPTGVTMSYQRRIRLIELADHYGVPIIEDDPYGQLRYEGEHIPGIEVLDSQLNHNSTIYTGNVIYLSTFSKLLAPGIRLGWVIAPPEVISKMVTAKQGTDLHTSTFTQMVAYEVSRGGFLDRHIQTINAIYRQRRDVMLASLAETMPEGVSWFRPQGGLFLWVTLPGGMSSLELFQTAIAEKVAFVPGAPFYPYSGGENTMRLNFSNANPEHIKEGIARLATAIKRKMARGG